MKQFEVKYLDDSDLEHIEQFTTMPEVQRFYSQIPNSYTTLSFKSLDSGRTVE